MAISDTASSSTLITESAARDHIEETVDMAPSLMGKAMMRGAGSGVNLRPLGHDIRRSKSISGAGADNAGRPAAVRRRGRSTSRRLGDVDPHVGGSGHEVVAVEDRPGSR